jgi:exonuclease III
MVGVGCYTLVSMDCNPEVLCWNVRGLNNPAKRNAVREFIASVRANLVCLQETKLDVIDHFVVMQCLGPSFDGFAYLPAVETRGGILVAWDSTLLGVEAFQMDLNSLTGLVRTKDGAHWWLTVVYAPQGDEAKTQFLIELEERRSLCPGPWMLIGDFNMILRASEKSNPNINRRMMAKFRSFVDDHELKEIYMHGRVFTWSNERDDPTLTKIDRALVSVDWELTYPEHLLQALSSSISDHAPLHLSTSVQFYKVKRFRFEVFWTKLDGFEEAVRAAWVCDEAIMDPFKRLDALFRNTAIYLQAWGQRKSGNIKTLMAVANWIIFRFDQVQEIRRLSALELWLRRMLKLSLLGLASLERTIDRQRSRIRWLRDGDANSKLFQAVANGRRSKNFIPNVLCDGEIIADQNRKEEVFYHAYNNLLGTANAREFALDLHALGMEQVHLEEMEEMFTEEEVWNVIKEIPADRAPGPDGFSGIFYHRAWPIIKRDIMAALLKLFVGDDRGFGKLNKAHIVLIPKRADAKEVGDYRPISLPHSFSKLFSKVLANRARRLMHAIIAPNQSAFIKGRNIHDNYLLVRQVARKIHATKQPGVFLKLDISRAFYSLSWAFLLEVLKARGFGDRWIKWISSMLGTASTKVIVNGIPGRTIYHAKGLRQGDPSSPLLFVIAMDALSALICKAEERGVLSSFRGISSMQRLSIYADDVALFIKPCEQDLHCVKELFHVFGMASGLRINFAKSAAIPIGGLEEDRLRILDILNCPIGAFPCKYLGIPLAINQLRRADWQPLVDQARKILPAWQRGLIQRQGRLILIKSVSSARPIHQLMVLKAPAWVFEEIEKWMRAFFWAGKDKVNGGQCLVAWDTVARPTCYGGLGIKNLQLQALALRVRWEWLRRVDPNRPWQGIPISEDPDAKQLFNSLVRIKVGSGDRTLFWRDRWIHGFTVGEIAPDILAMVGTRARNKTTVQLALTDNAWANDVLGEITFMAHIQIAHLCHAISTIERDPGLPDQFSWPADVSGVYTAKSVYARLCAGLIRSETSGCIWRSWAPLKCKIFAWLTVQYRLWTSDRRARHGLQDEPSSCYTCMQDEDNVDHILARCPYAREVWHRCCELLRINMQIPEVSDTFSQWWLRARRNFPGRTRRGFDSFVIGTAWALWKQRNARVFNRAQDQRSPEELVKQVTDDIRQWRLAGLGVGGLDPFVRE